MNKENKIKYVEALDNLMGGIKEDYKNWVVISTIWMNHKNQLG